MTTLPALRKGDTIAFVSPSSRLNDVFPDRLSNATRFFSRQGFHTKVVFSNDSFLNHLDAIEQRCEELHQAFRDPNIKAIVCTIGGFCANELLPHLDYELIRRNPKIFCGYSDITLLNHALLTQAGLKTFYGPAAIPEFGESPEPLEFTAKHFFSMLTGDVLKDDAGNIPFPRSDFFTQDFVEWTSDESKLRARKTVPSPQWKWLRPGRAKGRLLGGCLPSLVQLCGTKYCADYNGRILLLETPEGRQPGVPFPMYAARTAFADLRNAGILDIVAGLVVGRPYMYDEEMSAAFEKMILDQCYDTTYPILANVDTGHTDPMLTLPMDCLVSLDSDDRLHGFALLEDPVAFR